MESIALVLAVLLTATLVGFGYQSSRGQIKATNKDSQLNVGARLGETLGDRATLVQFSSAFCTPCRTTRTLLSQVITDYPGIKHIEIDAESNLQLVRDLNVKSTPTTVILDDKGFEISRAVGAPRRSDVVASLNAIR